jgi:hypothetical protein
MICDSTVDQLDLGAIRNPQEIFDDLFRLFTGNPIILTDEKCMDLRQAAEALDNPELLDLIMRFVGDQGQISVSNCLSRLAFRHKSGLDIEDEVNFVALHFHELGANDLSALPLEILEEIATSDCLRLKDEDSFLKFVLSLEEEKCSILCGYVECQYLSGESMARLLSKISPEDLNPHLWGSICRRLQCNLPNSISDSIRFGKISEIFEFSEGNEFHGILDHLSKSCGGNVHEKRIVDISSSGDDCGKCWEVASGDRLDYWYSEDAPNSWICFDFKDKRVQLESYALKSGSNGNSFPMEWEVSGSEDGVYWTSLDRRNGSELAGNSRVRWFGCADVKDEFRYVRLQQTGKNSSKADYLVLSAIELFGVLKC